MGQGSESLSSTSLGQCSRQRDQIVPAPVTHWRLFLQGTVVFTTQVPTLGRYAFLLHSYQPVHPTFPVEVLINGGRVWHGEWLSVPH